MKLSKLTFALIIALSTGASSSNALAIDLYVDTKTKQIFAEPGPGREKMGSFVRVEDVAAKNEPATVTSDITSSHRQDQESNDNAMKALEAHIAASKEEKAKDDEKWFNKINIRGYTQLRYNQSLSGDRIKSDPELRSVGDSSLKDNSGFAFRRVRLVFSGDINEYLYLYLQPDFASNVSSSIDNQNFVQLRDAYADISFNKKHEYRIRAGQSKVPFGWENLQSSQNRLALDRDDALNSAVPSERDLGLFVYWTPEHVQKLWKDLSKYGLKPSGDYGVVGAGVYNGQGLNRNETNDDLYVVAHTTYPIELNFLGSLFKDQVLEVGVDALSGYFNPTTADMTLFDKNAPGNKGKTILKSDLDSSLPQTTNSIQENRVGVHAIFFPQPFGSQAEWNWGKGATLNPEGKGSIESKGLNGGYVQVMYKIDRIFRGSDALTPYAKWQTYRGAWKGAANSPKVSVDEIEAGVEYQIMKALELTLAYSTMDRTNVSNLGQASGDLVRGQLQWNY